MSGKLLMVQGTCSNAGKSALTAGLCRYFSDLGVRVAPFKSWNMALNSYVTPLGDEIGRAQAEQALAARIVPSAEMNPFLLKPKGKGLSQIICLGKPKFDIPSGELGSKYRDFAFSVIDKAISSLRYEYDLIIIEGAGSPSEINVRSRDIANMEIALRYKAPVILVGDASRRGEPASIIGTYLLLSEAERSILAGIVVNKSYFSVEEQNRCKEEIFYRTGKSLIGFLPSLQNFQMADEDSVVLDNYVNNISKLQSKLDPYDLMAEAIRQCLDEKWLRKTAGV